MPSVHRQLGRPFWFCAFTLFDPATHTSRRVFRSTKTRDKKQALEICHTWHRAAQLARKGKLTVDAARDVIARGVSDVFTVGNAESLESATIKSWCGKWLETKSIEAAESTHARYARIVERFIDCIGAKANRDLSTLQPSDIAQFRDREAKQLSHATANLSLKVLRICFGEAVRQGLLTVNPGVRVKILKSNKESPRRPFTRAEIKRVLKACGDDLEWRGLVLFGLYFGGQRLGDLAKVTWRGVNFESREIAVVKRTRKTQRRVILPLVQSLVSYLVSLPASDDPNAFIFPRAAKAKRTGTLSNQFRKILVAARLAEPRTHEATGKGRSSARQTSELSFHSFRHTATTQLKAAGVSDAVAMAIVGHDSPAISREYTHFSTDVLRAAMEKLPDVTADE